MGLPRGGGPPPGGPLAPAVKGASAAECADHCQKLPDCVAVVLEHALEVLAKVDVRHRVALAHLEHPLLVLGDDADGLADGLVARLEALLVQG